MTLGLTRQVNGRFGAMFQGLDATPTGTNAAEDVVADFTGATEVQFADQSTATPIVAVHSQTQGSTFTIAVRGVWKVQAEIPVATAATVVGAVNFGGQAADFNVTPLASNTRNRSRKLWTGAAAGEAGTLLLECEVQVTQDIAGGGTGIVRVLLANNADGAATAASLAPLANARLTFTWIRDLPPG